MRSVTKFVLDFKAQESATFSINPDNTYKYTLTWISSQNTSQVYQSSTTDPCDQRNPQKCCILIYIILMYMIEKMTPSIWKLPPDTNPRGSKWPPIFQNLQNTDCDTHGSSKINK